MAAIQFPHDLPWQQQPPKGLLLLDPSHWACPRTASEGVWVPGLDNRNLFGGVAAAPFSGDSEAYPTRQAVGVTLPGSGVGSGVTAALFSVQAQTYPATGVMSLDTGIGNTVSANGLTLLAICLGSVDGSSVATTYSGPIYGGGAGLVWRHNSASYNSSFFVKGDGTYPVVRFGTNPLASNTWYMLAGTAGPGGLVAYQNGVAANSVAGTHWGTQADAGNYLIARAPGTAGGNTYNYQGNVVLVLKLDRVLTPQQIWSLWVNPWQMFLPVSAEIWPQSIASNVTLALTGVAGTGSVGSVVANVGYALAQVASTGSVGAVVANLSYGVTQDSAPGAVGTVTNAVAYGLSQIAGTGSVGAVSPALDYAISQDAGTGGVGSFPALTSPIGGVSGTGVVGTVTPSGDISIALTGVLATGLVGSVSIPAPPPPPPSVIPHDDYWDEDGPKRPRDSIVSTEGRAKARAERERQMREELGIVAKPSLPPESADPEAPQIDLRPWPTHPQPITTTLPIAKVNRKRSNTPRAARQQATLVDLPITEPMDEAARIARMRRDDEEVLLLVTSLM